MEKLAAAPRNDVIAWRYWQAFDQDARMVLRAGIRELLHQSDTSPAERETLQAILALDDWAMDRASGA